MPGWVRSPMFTKLQPAFDEETKMNARLGIAFALVALGQTKTEEFAL